MSSPLIQSFVTASSQVVIYIGFFGLISGLLGNTLNIIIFTSLKTFRETSCALYLTAASVFNIFHLIASLLSRVLIAGYGIDLTQSSLVLCKLRQFVSNAGTLMAVTCICLATIDQFLSLTDRWRYLNQRHIAWRLVLFTTGFWLLYSIPSLIYYNRVYSPNTDKWSCQLTNPTYSLYFTRFHISFLIGFIPLVTRIIFGLLAFINVRSLNNRRVPIVRLERDKQLTSMVLIEVLVDVILSFPFFIYYTYGNYISLPTLYDATFYQLMVSVTNVIYYSTFAIGFYIYCCSSSRYRKQFVYIVIKIHMKYWCGINNNQNRIIPQINETQIKPEVLQSTT